MEQKEQMTDRQKIGFLLSEIEKHGRLEESELQHVRDHDYQWHDFNGKIGSDVSFIGERVAPKVNHNDDRAWESYDLRCKNKKLGRIVVEKYCVDLGESEVDSWRCLISSYPKPIKKVGYNTEVTLISPTYEKYTGYAYEQEYEVNHSAIDGMAGKINYLKVLFGRNETVDSAIDHMYNAVVQSITDYQAREEESRIKLSKLAPDMPKLIRNMTEQNKPNDNGREM